jgi:sulfate adenylyltransferase
MSLLKDVKEKSKSSQVPIKELLLNSDQLATYQPIIPHLLSWDLSQRQLCDLELLINGGFSPLEGFLTETDYQSVLKQCRLANGLIWPMPITLDVSHEFANKVALGDEIALRDPEGVLIAIMQISDKYQPDKIQEAMAVFGTDDISHPGVNYLLKSAGPIYLGGKILGVSLPTHYDFLHLRKTPKELRFLFQTLGWQRIVGFQTRNPMHRAHQELTQRAALENDAKLLLHPSVGMTKPGDIDHYTRVRCYEKLLPHYPANSALLSLLPLAMRMGGPREALWHAIIRKNYGCTHFIVGRDHAGPGKNKKGEDFYAPYAAQELVEQFQNELDIQMLPFQEMVYIKETNRYVPLDEVKTNQTVLQVSGTEFRRYLSEGSTIPEWFSYPEVIDELRKTHPAKNKRGCTVFFTGLSGAGKSTLANALMVKLLEIGGRRVSILDGDLVRQHLSSELGFSKEHRDLNILRIGYVASEITKHGGIAICAPIAPYQSVRQQVRELIEPVGNFIEVYVATPLQVCEQRDRKGLYVKARAGLIKNFTGIDDPYEEPLNPEIKVDTSQNSPAQAIEILLNNLRNYI